MNMAEMLTRRKVARKNKLRVAAQLRVKLPMALIIKKLNRSDMGYP